MFKDVERLVSEITAKQEDYKSNLEKLLQLDEVRLERVVSTALPGLQFDKVWSTKVGYAEADERIQAECEYLRHEDKYLKGLKVGMYRGEGYHEDGYMVTEDTFELWLNARQFFVTRKTGTRRRDEWGAVGLERSLVQLDADPFEINLDTGELYWDADIIVDSIVKALDRRAEDLNERLLKQENRLDKLKALRL